MPLNAALTLCALAVAGAQPLPLRPHAPPARELRPGLGQVTHGSASGAFVDRGLRDGLADGQKLKVYRGGRVVGFCVIEALGDTTARCRGDGVEVGDVFRVRQPDEPEVKEPVGPLDPDEVLRRQQRLMAEGMALVTWDDTVSPTPTKKPERAPGPWLVAELGHTSWTTGGHADGAYHLETLDVALRQYQVLPGARLNVDAGLRWYSGRPQAFRDPATFPLRLRVREANVALGGGASAWRAAAGRLWVAAAPGLSMLDGVEGGLSLGSGLELGAFAGVLPEPTLAGLSVQRWTAGLTQGLRWDGQGALRRIDQRLRLAVVALPQLRVEAEATAHAAFERDVAVDLSIRGGVGGPAGSALDGVRLAASWRPAPRLLLATSARYAGQLPPEVVALSTPWTGTPGLHADLSGSWQLTSRVLLSISGGATRDFNAVLGRFWGGPSVVLPGLLPGGGALSAGWFEEAGYWGRRSVWAEGRTTVLEAARLSGRLSFTQATPTLGTGAFETPELGALVTAEVPLPRGLWTRGSLLVRQGLGRDFLGGEGVLRTQATTAWVLQLTLGASL